MPVRNDKPLNEDLVASMLRSQLNTLRGLLQYIEQGNPINGYVQDNIQQIEKDLYWLRKFLS